MRRTIRCLIGVSALSFGTLTAMQAQGQQVIGEYIVGARVISDVAINQDQSVVDHVHTPTASPSDAIIVDPQATPAYPVESYPTEGVPVESYPSGEIVEEGNASGGLRGKLAGSRLHTVIHGGEQGPFIPKQYANPDLFYNYYSNGQNQVNAEMYLSPGPVPPFVGNTWVTYQPFMPHNYLYPHKDKYHNHYDYGRGTNRTKIKYSVAPRQYAETIFNVLRLPR